MNKPFLKFCNSVDYKTYNILEDTFFWMNMATTLSNLFLFGTGDVIRMSVLSMMILSDFLYLSLRFSGGQYQTRDVVEVRKLYQEFLDNYTKLNKEFNFNDPVSIYALYNYMRLNGYLSKDKEKESSSDYLDIGTLYGVDVIRGNGVCRHISSMFTDILNYSGVEAMTFGCYLRDRLPSFEMVDKERYDREMIINFINKCVADDNEKRKLLEQIVYLEEHDMFLNVYFAFKPSKKNVRANHAITYAAYDGNNYYLDPTQGRIYRLKDGKRGILYDSFDDEILAKSCQLMVYNGVWNPDMDKTCKKIFKSYDCISLGEEKRIIDATKKIFLDNMDIVTKFYNENRDLYGEILNAASKVRVRKK